MTGEPWNLMTPEEIKKDLEKMAIKLDLNSRDLYPHQIEIVPNYDPELAGKITEDARKIIKLTMGTEYGNLSKLDKNKMYGTMVVDEAQHANGSWSSWLDFFDPFNSVGWSRIPTFINIRPLIPNRFDLKERAKNDPKFSCTPSDKVHTADQTKRKASRLARKARRNNRHG